MSNFTAQTVTAPSIGSTIETNGNVYFCPDTEVDHDAIVGEEVLTLFALEFEESLEISRADIGSLVTQAEWDHLLRVAKIV